MTDAATLVPTETIDLVPTPNADTLPDVLAGLGHVAEGVPAAAAVRALSAEHGVEMPICDAVHGVLYEGLDPRAAVLRLLQREPRAEHQ